MSSRNRFASFLQQMHQRLSEKLPQQEKLIEVAKRVFGKLKKWLTIHPDFYLKFFEMQASVLQPRNS